MTRSDGTRVCWLSPRALVLAQLHSLGATTRCAASGSATSVRHLASLTVGRPYRRGARTECSGIFPRCNGTDTVTDVRYRRTRARRAS